MQAALTVLYDADCALCSASASLLRRLDRGTAPRVCLLPLQAARLDPVAGDDPSRLDEAIHVRDVDGTWLRGGDAILRIAEALPALRLVARVGRTPLVHPLVEPLYRAVAGHRHRLGRMLRWVRRRR